MASIFLCTSNAIQDDSPFRKTINKTTNVSNSYVDHILSKIFMHYRIYGKEQKCVFKQQIKSSFL